MEVREITGFAGHIGHSVLRCHSDHRKYRGKTDFPGHRYYAGHQSYSVHRGYIDYGGYSGPV